MKKFVIDNNVIVSLDIFDRSKVVVDGNCAHQNIFFLFFVLFFFFFYISIGPVRNLYDSIKIKASLTVPPYLSTFLITVLIICERSVMLYRYKIYMIYRRIRLKKERVKLLFSAYYIYIYFVQEKNTRYFYKFVESIWLYVYGFWTMNLKYGYDYRLFSSMFCIIYAEIRDRNHVSSSTVPL